MFLGPVFNAELMTTARRARYYVIRFLYGSIILFSDLRDLSVANEYLISADGGEASVKRHVPVRSPALFEHRRTCRRCRRAAADPRSGRWDDRRRAATQDIALSA